MKIETKFSIGDEVYFMLRDAIYKGKIIVMSARLSQNRVIVYDVLYDKDLANKITLKEESLFSTAEELTKNLLANISGAK